MPIVSLLQMSILVPPKHCVSLGVMTTRWFFLFSGLGTSQAERVPSPHGYGQNTQVQCRHDVGDGPHLLGVVWVGPASLLLGHMSRVEHLDCYLWVLRGVDSQE